MFTAPGLIPYSIIVPFWSDGAMKTRWISVPNDGTPYAPGEQVTFNPTGEWSFPNGTVFVKHFELPVDDTDPTIMRRLETRFIVRDANGAVYGATYKWREDYTDADLLPVRLVSALVAMLRERRHRFATGRSPRRALGAPGTRGEGR